MELFKQLSRSHGIYPGRAVRLRQCGCTTGSPVCVTAGRIWRNRNAGLTATPANGSG